jgi:hypothetical protein
MPQANTRFTASAASKTQGAEATEATDNLLAPDPELASVTTAEPAIVLVDGSLMPGLNTVRLSVQIPFVVKTSDGEMTNFDEVTLLPGLQIISRDKWELILNCKNQIAKEALHRGAIREFMPTVEAFNQMQPYEAIDAIKRCIDESSAKLLEAWISGSLAAKNLAVRDALLTQIKDLGGDDAFAKAKRMMPTASV